MAVKRIYKNTKQQKKVTEVKESLTPIAIKGMSNFGGMVIYNIDGDIVDYGYDFGKKYKTSEDEVMTAEIEFDNDGEAYFIDQNGDTQYLNEFMRVGESFSIENKKKKTIYEELTDDDVNALGELDLQEDELSVVLNMFELVADDQKDNMMSLVKLLFEGKMLVPSEEEEKGEEGEDIEESYTNKLLKGYKR